MDVLVRAGFVAMAIGAKHVLVVAIATLLLTYAAYQGKAASHGDGVSLAGRKGLSEPQRSETTPVLVEDSVTESDAAEGSVLYPCFSRQLQMNAVCGWSSSNRIECCMLGCVP